MENTVHSSSVTGQWTVTDTQASTSGHLQIWTCGISVKNSSDSSISSSSSSRSTVLPLVNALHGWSLASGVWLFTYAERLYLKDHVRRSSVISDEQLARFVELESWLRLRWVGFEEVLMFLFSSDRPKRFRLYGSDYLTERVQMSLRPVGPSKQIGTFGSDYFPKSV